MLAAGAVPPKTQSGTTLGRPWAQQKGRAQEASLLTRSTQLDRDKRSPNLKIDNKKGEGERGLFDTCMAMKKSDQQTVKHLFASDAFVEMGN